jgi:hypothetical protein
MSNFRIRIAARIIILLVLIVLIIVMTHCGSHSLEHPQSYDDIAAPKPILKLVEPQEQTGEYWQASIWKFNINSNYQTWED